MEEEIRNAARVYDTTSDQPEGLVHEETGQRWRILRWRSRRGEEPAEASILIENADGSMGEMIEVEPPELIQEAKTAHFKLLDHKREIVLGTVAVTAVVGSLLVRRVVHHRE